MENLFQENRLTKQQSKEVLTPFPLARELFDFARKNLTERSYSVYTDPEYRKNGQRPVELPEKFLPFVADYPGKYFVVHFEENHRLRQVILSTTPYRYDSDDIVGEIMLTEPQATEGRGNVIEIEVSNRVSEKGMIGINLAEGMELNYPNGRAKMIFEVDSSGNKITKESNFDRMDEGLFLWRNKPQPVRWLRDLYIDNLPNETVRMFYKDSFLIGRNERNDTEERADVRIHIESQYGDIGSILIEIGLGAPSTAKTLFESEDKTIRVVEHSPEGMRAYRNQMEIIKQDPDYAFVFDKPIDQKKVADFVQNRIGMLKEHWFQKQSVFGVNKIDNSDKKFID